MTYKWYRYREATTTSTTEKWLSDVYVSAHTISFCGAMIVLFVMYDTWYKTKSERVSNNQGFYASGIQITCLCVCDALFAVVVLTWKLLDSLYGDMHCIITQPISVAVETMSMVASAAVALSVGVAVRTRDYKKTRRIGRWTIILSFILGIGSMIALYIVQKAKAITEEFCTCQYMRLSIAYYIELGLQLSVWILVCFANIFALASSLKILRNAPASVAERYIGRLARFSFIGITLWGARMIADLSRNFPGPYNILAICWVLPGFQGFLNAMVLGTGPLRKAIARTLNFTNYDNGQDVALLHTHASGNHFFWGACCCCFSSLDDNNSSISSDNDQSPSNDPNENPITAPPDLRDSFIRHLRFKSSDDVRIYERDANEESLLAQIDQEEKCYRRSEMEAWFLRRQRVPRHHKRNNSSGSNDELKEEEKGDYENN